MGVWQGMAMDSLKFHLGRPCPTLLHPAAGARRAGSLQQSSTPLDILRRKPMMHKAVLRTILWFLYGTLILLVVNWYTFAINPLICRRFISYYTTVRE
jgi:hypothetical protein